MLIGSLCTFNLEHAIPVRENLQAIKCSLKMVVSNSIDSTSCLSRDVPQLLHLDDWNCSLPTDTQESSGSYIGLLFANSPRLLLL